MEIRNLATFVRIAQLHNFSKAAEQLGYSQSAVTMQIKQLEEELNVRLFERIGKHIRPDTGGRSAAASCYGGAQRGASGADSFHGTGRN